ncbi:hypothetical protein BDZ89DRAFT_1045323 [Hymenopellis radicata]|nr:hypothetical protein BDZ89DRAFT_1045323 [Hymenopellis radicata]
MNMPFNTFSTFDTMTASEATRHKENILQQLNAINLAIEQLPILISPNLNVHVQQNQMVKNSNDPSWTFPLDDQLVRPITFPVTNGSSSCYRQPPSQTVKSILTHPKATRTFFDPDNTHSPSPFTTRPVQDPIKMQLKDSGAGHDTRVRSAPPHAGPGFDRFQRMEATYKPALQRPPLQQQQPQQPLNNDVDMDQDRVVKHVYQNVPTQSVPTQTVPIQPLPTQQVQPHVTNSVAPSQVFSRPGQIFPPEERWAPLLLIDQNLVWIEDQLFNALLMLRMRRDTNGLKRLLATLLLEIVQSLDK